MKKHIEKIKLKSEKERKKIAGIFAGIITFIIIIIWFFLTTLLPQNDVKNNLRKGEFEKFSKKIEEKISEIKSYSLGENGDNLEKPSHQINLRIDENPVYVDSLE